MPGQLERENLSSSSIAAVGSVNLVEDPRARFQGFQRTHPILGITGYAAGSESYSEALFTRDGIISGDLSGHDYLLRSAVEIAVFHQGKKDDPASNEREWEIFHELHLARMGGVEVAHTPGYNTFYAGSDTKAFLL